MERDALDALQAAEVARAMPGLQQQDRGDAFGMLREFHFNFPFVMVAPGIKTPLSVIFDGTLAVNIDVPDGAIAVQFTKSLAGDLYVSTDGQAAAPAVNNTVTPGSLINPPADQWYYCY